MVIFSEEVWGIMTSCPETGKHSINFPFIEEPKLIKETNQLKLCWLFIKYWRIANTKLSKNNGNRLSAIPGNYSSKKLSIILRCCKISKPEEDILFDYQMLNFLHHTALCFKNQNLGITCLWAINIMKHSYFM